MPQRSLAKLMSTATKTRGRPRSEDVDSGILESVLDALSQAGVAGVRIERIAANAGVSKASIYRRYESKEELIIAAIQHMRQQVPVVPATGTARERLLALLSGTRANMSRSRDARVMMAVMNSHEQESDLAHLVYERILQPRRELLRSIITEGIASGEFSASIDIEVMTPLLVGPMLYLGMWSMIDSVAQTSTEAVLDALLN